MKDESVLEVIFTYAMYFTVMAGASAVMNWFTGLFS
jgi:hypothetical protein